jgi:hypothetical protein
VIPALYVPPPVPAIILTDPIEELRAMAERDENGWTPRDYDEVIGEAEAGAFAAEDLGSCIAAESEFRCEASNPSGAKGLTQMMPSTLSALNWRAGTAPYDAAAGDFCRAPVAVQLAMAFKYFREWRKRFSLVRWRNRAQLFLANFLPADLPHAGQPDFVLAQDQGRRSRVWEQNRPLDRNRDGRIAVSEIELFLATAVTGRAREPYLVYLEGVQRARQRRGRPSVTELILGDDRGLRDVRDVRALQRALLERGYAPGPVDGIQGPRTTAALVAFQRARGLAADGLPGVFTWAALAAA